MSHIPNSVLFKFELLCAKKEINFDSYGRSKIQKNELTDQSIDTSTCIVLSLRYILHRTNDTAFNMASEKKSIELNGTPYNIFTKDFTKSEHINAYNILIRLKHIQFFIEKIKEENIY